MKQLLQMMREMKTSQEEMKIRQEESKTRQEEMQTSQEEIKEALKELEEEPSRGKGRQRKGQDEMKDKLQEMKISVKESNLKLETKLKAFEQVVEEEINQVKVKDEVKVVEKEINQVKDEVKATLLIAALRGQALVVLRIIPEASQNYATLTSVLERRYGDVHLQHVYQAQLRGWRHRFEESLQHSSMKQIFPEWLIWSMKSMKSWFLSVVLFDRVA